MPIPRLRRAHRPRSKDDDDWGTSSPAAIMKPIPNTSAAASSSSSHPTPAPTDDGETGGGGPIATSASISNSNPNSTPTVAVPPLTIPGASSSSASSQPQHRRPINNLQPQNQPEEDNKRSLAVAFSKLQQQDLKSYTTTFSPRCVISLYFIIAFFFLPLGIALVAGTSKLRWHGPISYHEKIEEKRLIDLTPRQTIRSPSYLYYSLSNFHQNSRDYVKSRSYLMNQGMAPQAKLDIENCEAYLCPGGGDDCLRDEDGNLNSDQFIYPCGLTAWSFFNDTFKLCQGSVSKNNANNCTKIRTSTEGIAWWTDMKYKFKPNRQDERFERINPDLNNRSANDLLEDPHFVVWMRLSAFPSFSKLYAIIGEDLIAGTNYTMIIDNVFPVNTFAGTKQFFITETTWFGDSNAFLATAYLIVGIVSLIVAVFLLMKYISNPLNPATIDPAILLREHLAKIENDSTPQPLHLN